ncbi:MAG TPA: helix-turn-helix domain-containing protein, partial [Nitrospinaceae bacterium]|nr:helix-turn-helix domain-containing protein [Nitrospinaceae bacterium]
MARRPRLGAKIRRLRRERDMTQAHLAQQLMISASYLNLIEHNQRAVTVSLLFKLGEVLDVDLQLLSQDDESQILAELTEILSDPLFTANETENGLTREDLNELVTQSPVASQTILKVYRAYQKARDDIQYLGERLSEDSLYSTSAHELRTVLTSIRSFAEILHDNVNISKKDRQKFLGIMVKESEELSQNIDALMRFVSGEGVNRSVGTRPPLDEVNDFLQNNRNYFGELEQAADDLVELANFGRFDRLQKLIHYAAHE